jgi:hypothetical protein
MISNKEYDLALTGVLFFLIFICFPSSLLCQARSGQEPEFLMVLSFCLGYRFHFYRSSFFSDSVLTCESVWFDQ